MAKMTIDAGLDDLSGKLEKLSGEGIKAISRRIVEAGAKAAAEEMRSAIAGSGHHITGAMESNTRPAEYHQTFMGGYQSVYPQGEDSRGVSNALKAFVINYGNGARMTRRSHGKIRNRTGDKFITGKFKAAEAKAKTAMAQEAEKALKEMGLTE